MKQYFSFGGGATSLIGGLEFIRKYPNAIIINAALLDDEPYVYPVIEAFQEITQRKVLRISTYNERLSFVAECVDAAYTGDITPQDLYNFIEDSKSLDSTSTYKIVDKPLFNTWHIDFYSKFMSNSRVDPCSRELKRTPIKHYLHDHAEHGAILGVSITADEIDRTMNITKNWKASGYKVEYPLIHDERWSNKQFVRDTFIALTGFLPESYGLDFEHNNCTPCRKGGKQHHARTLFYRRIAYLYAEKMEQLWRDTFNKDYTILRETRNGKRYNLTLRELRERLEHMQTVEQLPNRYIFDKFNNESGCSFCSSLA